MGFERGNRAIVKGLSCRSCQRGRHSECEYLQGMEAMNHTMFPDETAGNMIYLRPHCRCFIADEDRHYYGEDERTTMEPDSPPERRVRTWCTWEAHFRPFPYLVRREGFDSIADKIASALEEDDCPLAKRWSVLSLSGVADQVLTLSIDEPEAAFVRIELYQQDVGDFLAALGLRGYVVSSRRVNLDEDDQ